MKDCLFCNIIENKIPSYTIYEDDDFKVFLDIHPQSNGHCLVVPRKHINNLFDMDNDTFKKLNNIIKNTSLLLKEKLKYDGIRVVQNNGILQDIKHYHVHLIPAYKSQIDKSIEEIYKILKGENE